MWLLARTPTMMRAAVLATSFVTAYAGLETPAWSQTPDADAYNGEYVDETADMDPAALSEFRQPLSPYGSWADDPTYGTVWQPSPTAVGADFEPYVTAGHWALGTDNQWTWVSDYPWGWAPFHYGRWVQASGRWAWIPGKQYAPAWVVWRTGVQDEPYVGWAPMPPSWGWRAGVAVRLPIAAPRYTYVPSRYAFRPGLRAYAAPPARVALIAPRTRPYVAIRPGVRYEPRAVVRGPTVREAQIPYRAVPVHRVDYPANHLETRARVAAPPARAHVGAPAAPTARAYNRGHDDSDRGGHERNGSHRR
jgi:hypothetical protein